jgi:hypothetical protein
MVRESKTATRMRGADLEIENMDEETKDRRIKSVGYVGVLATFIGIIGIYVEVFVISDRDVAKLMRSDPLGLLAPLTLLLLGGGALIFSFTARRSPLASTVVGGMRAASIVYGVVATGVLLLYAVQRPSGLAIAYSLGVAVTLMGWIVGSIAAARYLRRLTS